MDRRAPRILVIGYNAFDVTVPLAGLPVPGAKTECPGMRTGGGGPGATAAVALARLGARVRLVTALTDDAPGRAQRAELETEGVDLSLCPRVEGSSPLAVILVDAGREQRTILWSRGRLPVLDPDLASEAWLDDTDLLYCDGHEPGLVLRLTGSARRRGIPVVMDAGSVREGSAQLAAACTDVISSEGFAPALTGRIEPDAALRALRRMGPERVGMTLGERGALALVGEEVVPVPAYRVEVIDTTGAGDAFHAGYAFARAVGGNLVACMRYGAAVAACKCRGWGGRAALPDREAVEALIAADDRRGSGV